MVSNTVRIRTGINIRDSVKCILFTSTNNKAWFPIFLTENRVNYSSVETNRLEIYAPFVNWLKPSAIQGKSLTARNIHEHFVIKFLEDDFAISFFNALMKITFCDHFISLLKGCNRNKKNCFLWWSMRVIKVAIIAEKNHNPHSYLTWITKEIFYLSKTVGLILLYFKTKLIKILLLNLFTYSAYQLVSHVVFIKQVVFTNDIFKVCGKRIHLW